MQWLQVRSIVLLILCSCVSLIWSVLKRMIFIASFLFLMFDVCWWKSRILLCNWMLLVVIHVSFHSFFVTLLQWIIWFSQRRWLRLLVNEETVTSFAATSAFSFPSILWCAGIQMISFCVRLVVVQFLDGDYQLVILVIRFR